MISKENSTLFGFNDLAFALSAIQNHVEPASVWSAIGRNTNNSFVSVSHLGGNCRWNTKFETFPMSDYLGLDTLRLNSIFSKWRLMIDECKIHNWKIICNVAAFSFSSFQLSFLGSFPLLSSQDASLARELLSDPRRQSLHCKLHSSTQSTIVDALDPPPFCCKF